MTETPTTPTTPPEEAPEVDPTPALLDAPKDAPEDAAKGYAVYDRTVGQYVGAVTSDKPSKADATKQLPKGHTAAIVRV